MSFEGKRKASRAWEGNLASYMLPSPLLSRRSPCCSSNLIDGPTKKIFTPVVNLTQGLLFIPLSARISLSLSLVLAIIGISASSTRRTCEGAKKRRGMPAAAAGLHFQANDLPSISISSEQQDNTVLRAVQLQACTAAVG